MREGQGVGGKEDRWRRGKNAREGQGAGGKKERWWKR